jgi:hypothetical protein
MYSHRLRGLKLAREYHSKRHISRLQRVVDRLAVTPFGKDKQVQELQEALRIPQREQE